MHHHVDRVSLAKGRIERTDQGYLWCRDVPLARTGTMDYAPFEVPIPVAPGQRTVTVERTADEVFSLDAIASFRGMPLTDDHPAEFVTADTHREHHIGSIHEPRRGQGEHADCLVADLLVTDPRAVELIQSGRKRQLSCGYDADYVDIRPGYGRQVNIRGNHVSLVDAGRAGPRIAIRDRLMPKSDTKRRGFADALRGLFGAKDDAEREAHYIALDEAMGDPDGSTVNVHVHAPPKDDEPPKPGEGEVPAPEEGKGMDEDKVKEICVTAIGEALAPWAEKFDAMATALGEMKQAGQATAEQVAAVAEAVEDITDPEDMATQDAVARAEVLKPGVKLPAMDGKPGSSGRKAALTGFMRTTLSDAFASDPEVRAVIRDAVGSPHPDFSKMSPSDVGILFRATSSAVRDARMSPATSAVPTFPPRPEGTAGAPTVLARITDAAALNAYNRKRWNRA